ncbi:MAG: DUF2851 family protein [Bacteroidota bacterium]
MREDFLHYVWKHKKFDILNLKTTQGHKIEIVSTGAHNQNSGPDFFNAQLKIDNQLWAGNVEIHIKSSDWYAHHHEIDKAYDNVILHVVFEDDAEIYRKDNSVIPTLEIKYYLNSEVVENYNRLFSKSYKWINCEANFQEVDDFIISNWLQALYFERLEQKSRIVKQLLKSSNNDWEAVLFKLLAKNFGLKVNGDAFLSIASSMDFSVVRKTNSSIIRLEAIFFGQSNLLAKQPNNDYENQLLKEYEFLKQKFQLNNVGVLPLKFFRLRPPNFPTIRLSQLANLYHRVPNLFSNIIEAKHLNEFYDLFLVGVSDFWKTHYTFEKESKPSPKVLTKSFMDLVLINTILPLKFQYAVNNGKTPDIEIIDLIQAINSEQNSIVQGFNNLKPIADTALESQALLQLKAEYCDKNQCLKCAIGNSLLGK